MRRTRGFRKRRALQEVQLEVVLALDGAPHEHVVGGKVQRAERLRRLAQRPKHRPRASLRGHVGCRSDAVEFESLCCASRILAFLSADSRAMFRCPLELHVQHNQVNFRFIKFL